MLLNRIFPNTRFWPLTYLRMDIKDGNNPKVVLARSPAKIYKYIYYNKIAELTASL